MQDIDVQLSGALQPQDNYHLLSQGSCSCIGRDGEEKKQKQIKNKTK